MKLALIYYLPECGVYDNVEVKLYLGDDGFALRKRRSPRDSANPSSAHGLFVIILDFKGGQEFLDCLKSVERAKIPTGWEKQVLVIDNRRNLGFSRVVIWELKIHLPGVAGSHLAYFHSLVIKHD